MRCVVTTSVAAQRNPFHRRPESQEKAYGDAYLRLPIRVEIDESAEEITYGNGLQGVREQVDAMRVEGHQIALHHHTEDPKQQHTAA